MPSNNPEFTILGRITGRIQQKGLAGLRVSAIEKDFTKDEPLGATFTDEQGYFRLTYRERDFTHSELEGDADVVVQVQNTHQDQVWSSQIMKHSAGTVLHVPIELNEALEIKQEIPAERLLFSQLIAVNPNYFGTLPELDQAPYLPVFPQQAHSTYEDLCGVGLNPPQDMLQAVIRIKQASGYGTGPCGAGSREYVAFYVDYGSGWQRVGTTVTTVHSHPSVSPTRPLCYAVRQRLTPEQVQHCSTPQLVRVRAILSWNDIPTGANFTPVWGEVQDQWVQIRPRKLIFVPQPDPFLPGIDLPEPDVPIDGPNPDIGPAPVLTAGVDFFAGPQVQLSGSLVEIQQVVLETAQLEKPAEVEEERFAFIPLLQQNPNYFASFSAQQAPEAIQADLLQLDPKVAAQLFDKGLPTLVPVLPKQGDVSYEQLRCVGYQPSRRRVSATLEVKREKGYQGSLCQLGSQEFVTFYVYAHGSWHLLGTESVRVHDIDRSHSENPLHYAVELPTLLMRKFERACGEHQMVWLRGILSWNLNPEPFGPHFVPTYGNVLDCRVALQAEGRGASAQIDYISGVVLNHTDQTAGSASRGMAVRRNQSGTEVPGTYDRPFSGLVEIQGSIEGATYYKFEQRRPGESSFTEMSDPFYYYLLGPSRLKRNPINADNWFRVSTQINDAFNEGALLHFPSKPENNGLHTFRLILADNGFTPIYQEEVFVYVNNDPIEWGDFFNSNLPAEGVTVKGGGAFKRCGDFAGEEGIEVWGNFRHPYYRHARMLLFGGNIQSAQTGYGFNGLPAPQNMQARSHYLDSYQFGGPLMGIQTDGIRWWGDPGTGNEMLSFNLAAIPTMPGETHVACAYALELWVYTRQISGRFRNTGFDTTEPRSRRVVTFNWAP